MNVSTAMIFPPLPGTNGQIAIGKSFNGSAPSNKRQPMRPVPLASRMPRARARSSRERSAGVSQCVAAAAKAR
jgi:hypothetical protein